MTIDYNLLIKKAREQYSLQNLNDPLVLKLCDEIEKLSNYESIQYRKHYSNMAMELSTLNEKCSQYADWINHTMSGLIRPNDNIDWHYEFSQFMEGLLEIRDHA